MLGRRQALKIVQSGIVRLDQWENLTAAQLMEFDGYKDTKANRIIAELKDAWPLVRELAGLLDVKYDNPSSAKKVDPKVAAGTVLGGKSFCFTGAMAKPRKELQSIVSAKGGVNFDDVNGGLDYLVIEDISSTSSKAKKARKLGTKLLSESDFLKMAGV